MRRVGSGGELCARKGYFVRRVAYSKKVCARKVYSVHKLCVFLAATRCPLPAVRCPQPAVRCRPPPSAAAPASSSILKPKFAVGKSYLDFAVAGDFAANDLGGKFVDELLLEESLYRAGAVGDVVAFGCQIFKCFIREGELNSFLGKQLLDLSDLEHKDATDIVGSKRLKHDYLVNSVDKLGTKEC